MKVQPGPEKSLAEVEKRSGTITVEKADAFHTFSSDVKASPKDGEEKINDLGLISPKNS